MAIFDLVLTDWFFFLVFFLYFWFIFAFRVIFAWKASKIEKLSTDWWEAYHDYWLYFVKKTYVSCVRAHYKPLKKEYIRYWLHRHMDKKLNFKYNLYIKLVSYMYILLYITAFCIFLFLNIFMKYLDIPALITCVRVFFGNHFLHLIFCCFLYRLFLSYIFPNIKLRHFIRFHSVFCGFCCGIVDSYKISNSFLMHKLVTQKTYIVDRDVLYYSDGLLGMRKYIAKFFSRKWYKYWFTLENNKIIYNRYYIPIHWSNYKSIELDELVDTPYYRFKMWLVKWKYLVFTNSVKPYFLKQKLYKADQECLELSRHYEHNLKMNYKYKN